MTRPDSDQRQPAQRPVPRCDEYEPAGPDDTDYGPVPTDDQDGNDQNDQDGA